MANKVTVKQGQTLPDMAMQTLGSMEGLFALALLNGLSITDDLVVNQVINADIPPYSKTVLKVYADNGYFPASGVNPPNTGIPAQLQGIGYWAIDVDFIVS